MSEHDPLEGVEERLESLEGRSLAEHADVLEETHQLLVAELDGLDGAASTDHAPPGREPGQEAED